MVLDGETVITTSASPFGIAAGTWTTLPMLFFALGWLGERAGVGDFPRRVLGLGQGD